MTLTQQLTFHHVGVGTPDMAATLAVYQALGYNVVRNVDDEGLNVRIAFLRQGDGPLIEVVAPLGEDGPLASLLAKKILPAPYHTCYAVADLAQATPDLRKLGFLPVTRPQPAKAFDGQPIAYFYHQALGLLELVENPPAFV